MKSAGSYYLRCTGLALVMLLYLGLVLAFSAQIPLSKAPDEYAHFLYARFLAEHARPPINDQERREAGYKSDQPPLYHALVALVTSGIDTSPPPAFKFTWEPAERQLIDIVLPRALLVYTEDETWPYQGLFLAWFAGRWLSIVFSTITVAITYLAALDLFPGQRYLALAAAGALAFTPRYIFTAAVLNDDNLIGLFMALFLWGLIRLVKSPRRQGAGWFIGLGLILGLALNTKYSVLLVPLELALITVWLARQQPYPWHYGLTRLAAAGLAAAMVAGVWVGFVVWNFNQIDELGPVLGLINPIIAGDASDEASTLISGFMTGDRQLFSEVDPGPSRGNLLAWSHFFFEQFWDVPVFGSPRLYPAGLTVLPALLLCCLAGWGWWRCRHQAKTQLWLGLLLLHVVTFLPIPLLRFAITGQIHDTAQARHLLFPAGPALAILLAGGTMAHFRPRWQPVAAFIPIGFTFGLTVLHLYYYSFAFPPPLPVHSNPALADSPQTPLSVGFDNGLLLRGFDWQLTADHVLALSLYWQATARPGDDYRTEITLYNEAGDRQLRWLSHPAEGRYPTRAWDAGDSVRDTLRIPLIGLPAGEYRVGLRLLNRQDVPLSAAVGDSLSLMSLRLDPSPPAQVTLWQAGRPVHNEPIYRYRATIPLTLPGNRSAHLSGPDGRPYAPLTDGLLQLFMVDHTWPSGAYRVQVDGLDTGLQLWVENFKWTFTPPEMSHIVNANFNNEIMLLGYNLPLRRIEPGDGVPLVLYWQSLRHVPKSYIIFDRLLDANRQPWGGYDRLPKETYPTHLWVPGEVVADGFAVPVDPAAPNGIYDIVVGLYDQADPAAQSLPLVQNGQLLEETSVRIGPIKIGGPPPDVMVTHLNVENLSNVDFGETFRLVGYNLTRSEQRVLLELFWQSLAQTPVDYTTFVHMLNKSNQIVAQSDRPPGNGQYPTSLWDVGEIIVNPIDISWANVPDGSYRLVVGLYNPSDGVRLSTSEGQNSVLLQIIKK